MLSASPTSIFSWLSGDRGKEKLSLDDFLRELPTVIDATMAKKGTLEPRNGDFDPVAALFHRVSLDISTWQKYVHCNETKNYTRNLVATDGTRYTLLVLCWNPGQESPIHDHPCDGCWMRVVQGTVQECQYTHDEATDKLVCYADRMYQESQAAYISDSMGFHKVGNPSLKIPAVTVHLYCPPFSACKIWHNPNSASSSAISKVCFHSAYGRLL